MFSQKAWHELKKPPACFLRKRGIGNIRHLILFLIHRLIRMILIYAPSPTPRLVYAMQQALLGAPMRLTENLDEYRSSALPGICYHPDSAGRGLHIVPCGLLGERKYRTLSPETGELPDGTPVLFPTPGTALGFDLPSALFFLLSRYEEYGSKQLDEHRRFLPENSVLHRMDCLDRPIADEWRLRLFREIQRCFPDWEPPRPKGRVLPTHDIDLPYRYRCRGILRTAGAWMRDLLRKDFPEALQRLKCVCHLSPDPYFNLPTLAQADREAGYDPIFFIHCGPCGKYDRKDRIASRSYRQVLRHLAEEKYRLGLHPSYKSDSDPRHIAAERKAFAAQTGKAAELSRQHYLRFRIPHTPRALLEAGLTDDYSLGYSSCTGFRAGTCHPFPYFDLGFNVPTELILHPLIAMDVTLQRDMHLSPPDAEAELIRLARTCLGVGGEFIFLVHNSSLAEKDVWKGWRHAYLHLLTELRSLEQAYSTRTAKGDYNI